MAESGQVAESLDEEVKHHLRQTERERDILNSAGHFKPTRVAQIYQVISRLSEDAFP